MQEFEARFPVSALKETKMFLLHLLVKLSIVGGGGGLRDREVACSASDIQGLNFEFCVWRAVSSHRPLEIFLAKFTLYVHKSGLIPDSFHFRSHGNYRISINSFAWPI